jgi:lipoate-protein ligase A
VLDRGRHNVNLPLGATVGFEAQDGQVVALSRAAGEDNFAARSSCHLRDLLPGVFHRGAGAPAIIMGPAACVPEAGFQMPQEDIPDAWIDRRGGCAVEIDGSVTSLHADRCESNAIIAHVRLLTALAQSAAENLALDEHLLGEEEETLRFWECERTTVVVGRGAKIEEQVHLEACASDGVKILRRGSGGGAVVIATGCLNYSLLFSLVERPRWRDVRCSFREILNRMADAVEAEIGRPSDLVWRGRKVSGNAQRRTRNRLLHHGTLLYGFDAELAARYLREPARQPEYRKSRRHTEFLGNLPYPVLELQLRVADVWRLCV